MKSASESVAADGVAAAPRSAANVTLAARPPAPIAAALASSQNRKRLDCVMTSPPRGSLADDIKIFCWTMPRHRRHWMSEIRSGRTALRQSSAARPAVLLQELAAADRCDHQCAAARHARAAYKAALARLFPERQAQAGAAPRVGP